jgi:hypothetical protein
MNYRFIGYSTDGLMLFQDLDYPSDAPQAYPTDTDLRRCHSADCLIDGDKYFAVSARHAEVRGLVKKAIDGEDVACSADTARR